ncbi:MAG: response regulator [Pirellulaceae bacterium]|nr:response regulator [Pirellulaceae bacterium]
MTLHYKPDAYLQEMIGGDYSSLAEQLGRDPNKHPNTEQVTEISRAKEDLRVILRWMPRAAIGSRKIEAFLEEIFLLGQIECPSFLTPLEFGITDSYAYVVQPKVFGRRLSEIIGLGQSPSQRVKRALSIACDVLVALEKVHELGCVARNVRASNVFLMGERVCFACPGPGDYCDRTQTNDDLALEYARFSSPEVSGAIQAPIGPASDLYSLGILLFHLVVGREPFQGDSVSSILYQHVTVDPQIYLADLGLPISLVDIILRLLKKDPRSRYQKASAVLSDLRQLQLLLTEGQSLDDFVIGRDDIRGTLAEPSFVGRKPELDKLQQHVIECRNEGKGHSVAVAGLAGFGKTRLVEELIRLVSRQPLMVYRSIAVKNSRETPLSPLLRIVEQVKSRAETCERFSHHLSQKLIEFRSEISLMFPELAQSMGWEWSGALTPEDLNRTQVENAIIRLLSVLGQPGVPALIWIDDCQNLDPQALAVIGKASEALHDNSIYIFSLSTEEDANLGFLEHVETEQCINLAEMNDEEIAGLIGSLGGKLPETAISAIQRLAAGSPFMATAILQGLIENQAIIFERNHWRIDNRKLNSVQTSENSVSELVNRLSEVPLRVKQVLFVAAISVNEFDELQLSEICQMPKSRVEECLAWSRSKRILWQLTNGKYLFVHERLKESLLTEITSSKRRELHLAFAHYLENNDPENISDLAYHYHLAESHAQALAYALRATAQAQRLQSLEKAEEFLRIAMLGLPYADAITSHEVYSQMADVLMLAGRYDESAHWLDKTLESSLPPLELARIKMKLGNLAFKRGDKELAGQKYMSALHDLGHRVPGNRLSLFAHLTKELIVQTIHTLFPYLLVGRKKTIPKERQRLIWRLHSRVGHAFWYTRDKYYTLWAHLRHMNLSEVYSPTLELAQAYSEHAPAMSLLPWFNRGIKYVQRSLAIREKFEHKWGQGQSRNYHSILLYSSSLYHKCIEQAERSSEILTQTGDPWEVHIAKYQQAASLLRLGDLKAALELARQTYDSAIAIGDYQSTGNIIDVWVRAAVGDIPEELLLAEVNREFHDVQGHCQVLLAHGIYLYFQGNYQVAEKKFSEAIKIAEKSGCIQAYVVPNYAWHATALRRQLETKPPRSPAKLKELQVKMLKSARRAVRISRRFTNDLPHALRELGAALAIVGRGRGAKAQLLQSMAVAKRHHASYELALTQELYGLIGREYGWPKAADLLEQGQESLRELRKSVARVEKVESISMLDRFDNLLVAGRQIISGHAPNEILSQTIAAAKKLLRGQRILIVERRQTPEGDYWFSQDSKANVDLNIIEEAVAELKTIVRDSERYLQADVAVRRHGTYLCSPIVAYGNVIACLYVANEFLTGLFGDDELRIADYLTATAGGALEKADGFRQLEELNVGLEQIVKERTATIEARSSELEQTALELMATQTKLEQARDEAERANATKSEFLARISHEIRTPIAAIMGFTELLLRGAVRDPDQQSKKLETILGNSSHLLQLINDLLDISKIEADKLELEAIQCSPVVLLQEVFSLLAVRAEQNGIQLTLKLDGPIPAYITSDPTRLKQILINIIGNAIKFTSVGEVAVIARLNQKTIESGLVRPVLEFEVRDSGIGMTPEQLAGLFKPFSQADSTITRKYGGTGLGLAISKRLSQALGGDLSATSESGVGSTFTVQIDPGDLQDIEMTTNESASDSLNTQSAKPIFVKADLRGLRVLVVDDAQTNRDLLNLMLKDAGAEVTTLCNGQEAVDAIQQDLVCDLVLLDMQMPVLDGYSAAKKLRQLQFSKPIIALTANTMVGDEEKCRKAGCTDYLSKPIDMNRLFAKLGELHGTDIESLSPKLDTIAGLESPVKIGEGASLQRNPNNEALPIWTEELPEDEIFRSFAEDFVKQVNDQFTKLSDLTHEMKFEEVASKAHWIKGTGGTVGLPTMSVIAKELEDATKARDYEQMLVSLEKLSQFIGHEQDN